MLHLRSPTTKYPSFPIRDSKPEKIPMGTSNGLYHVTTTTGFDQGLESSSRDK